MIPALADQLRGNYVHAFDIQLVAIEVALTKGRKWQLRQEGNRATVNLTGKVQKYRWIFPFATRS